MYLHAPPLSLMLCLFVVFELQTFYSKHLDNSHTTHFTTNTFLFQPSLRSKHNLSTIQPRTLKLHHNQMASSSLQQDILESTSNMQQGAPESTSQEDPGYEITGRTMKLEEWDLAIQKENPVDLISLAHHGCEIRSYYEA
jgi:hypothetical protein